MRMQHIAVTSWVLMQKPILKRAALNRDATVDLHIPGSKTT